MTYVESVDDKKSTDSVLVICDFCKVKTYSVMLKNAIASIKKYSQHKCASCAAKGVIRKICSKEYWNDPLVKQKHSETIKNSSVYKEAIKHRDQTGSKNGMYGKTHSVDTIKKMSLSRKGKTGENATAWKGGKCSINKRIKKFINTECKWSFNIFTRDNWKCVKCASSKHLDAHHVIPLSKIIKNLLKNNHFTNDDEKVKWLIQRPEVVDSELKNGITLCRECHKNVHINWGSHEPKV